MRAGKLPTLGGTFNNIRARKSTLGGQAIPIQYVVARTRPTLSFFYYCKKGRVHTLHIPRAWPASPSNSIKRTLCAHSFLDRQRGRARSSWAQRATASCAWLSVLVKCGVVCLKLRIIICCEWTDSFAAVLDKVED